MRQQRAHQLLALLTRTWVAVVAELHVQQCFSAQLYTGFPPRPGLRPLLRHVAIVAFWIDGSAVCIQRQRQGIAQFLQQA